MYMGLIMGSAFCSIRLCVCFYASTILVVCYAMLSHFIVSDPLRPLGPQPTRILCPWDSPGKNMAWVAISFCMFIIALQYSSKPRNIMPLAFYFLFQDLFGYSRSFVIPYEFEDFKKFFFKFVIEFTSESILS